MIKVSPSILSADFAKLGADVEDIKRGGADYVHVDVMDGIFVPNISIGIPVVKSLRKGAKDAKLEYTTLQTIDTEKGEMSLVKIRLHTGRTHQIRVQFSHRKMPLVGDGKYGSHENGCFLSLWSHHLEFHHPTRKITVSEYSLPPKNQFPWKLFKLPEIPKTSEE